MRDQGCWFIGYTLIDITNTNIKQNNSDKLGRSQQRNWESIIQTISLRAQPLDIIPAKNPRKVSLSSHKFGNIYTGLHICWKFMFYVEHKDVFGTVEDPFKYLNFDVDQVPIIPNLTETISISEPVFCTTGDSKNIYFSLSNNF